MSARKVKHGTLLLAQWRFIGTKQPKSCCKPLKMDKLWGSYAVNIMAINVFRQQYLRPSSETYEWTHIPKL